MMLNGKCSDWLSIDVTKEGLLLMNILMTASPDHKWVATRQMSICSCNAAMLWISIWSVFQIPHPFPSCCHQLLSVPSLIWTKKQQQTLSSQDQHPQVSCDLLHMNFHDFDSQCRQKSAHLLSLATSSTHSVIFVKTRKSLSLGNVAKVKCSNVHAFVCPF